jgi:C4-dicarboxylate transporter DctM subunit
MSSGLIVLLMVFVFLALSYLGTPVAFALIAGVLVGTLFADVSLTGMVGQLFNGVNSIPLLAVPFFLLAAELMNSSNITEKIIRFVQTLVGHVRSGLAQVNAVFSMFFAGISGSSNADVAANSKILLPAMKKEGYDPASSAALIAAASTIANMIPPSIMAIIYGAVGGVSIAALFLGGATPGVMVGVGLMVYSYFFVRAGEPPPRASFREVARAGAGSALPLMVPFIIMGGILTGYFTPTEAGMVAAVYIIFILIPLMAWRHLRHLPKDFIHAGVLYSLPLIAVAAASAFAWLFAFLGGARTISEWVQAVAGTNPLTIMLVLVVMLIIVGQFIDAIPAIVIFMPIIAAFSELGDINPIHMGVVVIVTLAFGLITPPYGLALLLATSFAGVRFSQGLRKSVPLYVLFLGIIAALVLVPELSLWLPRLLVPQAAGCFPDPRGEGYICP